MKPQFFVQVRLKKHNIGRKNTHTKFYKVLTMVLQGWYRCFFMVTTFCFTFANFWSLFFHTCVRLFRFCTLLHTFAHLCKFFHAFAWFGIMFKCFENFCKMLSNSFKSFSDFWRYVLNGSYLKEFSVKVIFQEQIEKRFLCQRMLEKCHFAGALGQYCLLKHFILLLALSLDRYF